MRVHRCNWIGCRELVPYDQKFCELHEVSNQRQYEHYQQELSQSLKGTRRERHMNQQAQAKYDMETRDQDATAFYHSRRWVKLSRYVKVKQGYISEVSGQVLSDNNTQLDHVTKRSLLPKEQWYDTSNLWLLSKREHSIKTAIEAKMVRDGKADVLKHLDKEWWKKVIRQKLEDK